MTQEAQSAYLGELDVRDLGNYSVRLLEDLTYHRVTGEVITIPRGFVTDYASVPRLLWNIIPPHGPAAKPAVIHDFLYSKQGDIGNGHPVRSRLECDLIFLEVMSLLGFKLWKRRAMYRGVRIGGWYGWRKARLGDTIGSQTSEGKPK